MNDFVSIEILGTMAGCSLIITLLTHSDGIFTCSEGDLGSILGVGPSVGHVEIYYLTQQFSQRTLKNTHEVSIPKVSAVNHLVHIPHCSSTSPN